MGETSDNNEKIDLAELDLEERRKLGKKFKKEVMDLRERLKGRSKIVFGENVFMPRHHIISVKAKNLDDLFFKFVLGDLESGNINYIDSGSYEGTYRLELDHANFFVENPTERPLAPQSSPGIPAPTDEKAIDKYFHDYIIGDTIEPNEHYKYSSWIVGIKRYGKGPKGGKIHMPLTHKGIPRGTRLNQLEWCADHFVNKGYGTNHCYITVGCAEGLQRYDWPHDTETEKPSTECLRGLSLKIRKDKEGNPKLNVTAFFRSWDLFSGLPENLGGIVKFMEYFSELVNIKKMERERELPDLAPGLLIGNSDGLHIYQHSADIAPNWIGVERNKNY